MPRSRARIHTHTHTPSARQRERGGERENGLRHKDVYFVLTGCFNRTFGNRLRSVAIVADFSLMKRSEFPAGERVGVGAGREILF